MADIKLSPEELMVQSTEMTSLQTEYETLFSQVTNALNGINDSWSENLASNFVGKIQHAQKSFSSIANMLINGASAARISSITFSSPGDALSKMLGTGETSIDNLSGLAQWIQENGDKLGTNDEKWMSAVMGMNGLDSKAIQSVMEKITSGDYEGALKIAGEKSLDWVADAMSGDLPKGSWVEKLNKETGGTLGLEGLEKSFYKNWMGKTVENAADIVKDMYSGNPDYANELNLLGQMGWNFSAGSVLSTAGDTAWNVVKDIPYIGEWYQERGATDAESAFSVGLGEITYAMTGNSEDATYVKNYYSNHGGIAKGVVDGVSDIANFAWEKGSDILGNSWKSILGQ